jgi:hypothetical protein
VKSNELLNAIPYSASCANTPAVAAMVNSSRRITRCRLERMASHVGMLVANATLELTLWSAPQRHSSDA